mmetsp:Transcript_98211/g.249223  ORF Transcript_98211/g.249223 Transcript_98211/m.249223 type:complete len:202 (+) Transcript_98211:1015-1620(+)
MATWALRSPMAPRRPTESKPAPRDTYSEKSAPSSAMFHIQLYPPQSTAVRISTTVLWPMANQKPTETGCWPWSKSCLVTLSMAAKWSQSTACRKPKANAMKPCERTMGYVVLQKLRTQNKTPHAKRMPDNSCAARQKIGLEPAPPRPALRPTWGAALPQPWPPSKSRSGAEGPPACAEATRIPIGGRGTANGRSGGMGPLS